MIFRTGSEGELRDRVFELARRAGVVVKQLYVIPTKKEPMVNAFAARGGLVLLTDSLVRKLGKREVDAVVSHELGHLKHRHPLKLKAIFAVVFIAAALAPSFISLQGPLRKVQVLVFPSSIFLGLAVVYFASRRFEFTADAEAVALTEDPEAMIRALAEITRLNLVPMSWGTLGGKFLTHPSTLRRAQAIAWQGGLARERVIEVLETQNDDESRYGLPPEIEGESLAFSTKFKNTALMVILAEILIVPVILSVAAALFARNFHLSGVTMWTVYTLGAAIILTTHFLVRNRLVFFGYRALKRALKEKTATEGIQTDQPGCVFAGFGPAAEIRNFEGQLIWDVGFLWFGADRLTYVGERTRFSLWRDHILNVSYSSGPLDWFSPQAVFITWADGDQGKGGTFYLRPFEVLSLSGLSRFTRTFADRLSRWKVEGREPFGNQGPPKLGTPEIGEVTSVPLGGSFRQALVTAVVLSQTAWIAGLVFGLSHRLAEGGGVWFVMAMVFGVLMSEVVLTQLVRRIHNATRRTG